VSVGLYLDEHVHRAIATSLRLRGVDVLTAQEDGRRQVPDPVLLDRATELGRIMFSQDEDFLAEANRRQRERIPLQASSTRINCMCPSVVASESWN
jgi:predicted nuclease of predicted toxin-antitoxin system